MKSNGITGFTPIRPSSNISLETHNAYLVTESVIVNFSGRLGIQFTLMEIQKALMELSISSSKRAIKNYIQESGNSCHSLFEATLLDLAIQEVTFSPSMRS